MKFAIVPQDMNFLLLKFASENGRWELGIAPVLFGKRVVASLAGSEFRTIDYCAGEDWAFCLALLETVKAILERLPETVSERAVELVMPKWKRRPINLDQECWGKLQRMAMGFPPVEVAQAA